MRHDATAVVVPSRRVDLRAYAATAAIARVVSNERSKTSSQGKGGENPLPRRDTRNVVGWLGGWVVGWLGGVR